MSQFERFPFSPNYPNVECACTRVSLENFTFSQKAGDTEEISQFSLRSRDYLTVDISGDNFHRSLVPLFFVIC